MNSDMSNKVALEYFPVNSLSFKKKNQLLKSIGTKNAVEISNKPPYIIKNSKKENEYIDSLKNDIHFSVDVAAERCVHLLSYDDRYYDTLYQLNNHKSKSLNPKTVPRTMASTHRCVPSVNTTTIAKLPPVRKHKISQDDGGTCVDESLSIVTDLGRQRRHWDEYLLSLMSPGTAQYLAFEASHNAGQAERLQRLVERWYGPAPTYCELVPDDSTHESEDAANQNTRTSFPYKYFMDLVKRDRSGVPAPKTQEPIIDNSSKKRICDLISREMSFSDENQQTDPYGDATKASFYRLPLLLRRQKKNTDIFVKDSGNKTTENISEYRRPPTPPRRLDTVLNPKIGDKILMSDNQFQQDLLLSTEIHQRKALNQPDNFIMLDDKVYKKSLQPVWPITITSTMPSEDNLDSYRPLDHRQVKGHNRWTDLPEKEETNLQRIDEENSEEEQARLESRKRVRDHSSVNLIVDQWRKKWQLTQKYNDSTVDALLKDMMDAHPTIRMQAIVTVAKCGTQATSLTEDRPDGQRIETINSDVIPNVLIESIEILLDDHHPQVKKVAAVALHSFERQSDRSLKILRDMLASGSSVDRWTAAQCLALSDVRDSHVIGELVSQLMNSEDFLIHERASILLAKISFHTKLVHGMLGEKLNTVSWRQRVIICKTLPLLHGSLNKDILRKLIYLMWQDQHRHVRIASSQAIGKTGNGKAVHDELIKKLQDPSETVRADALEKIGILKVMTSRLMPSFLKCFEDDFVIVRKEVCRACCRLAIEDEVCVRMMLGTARYDPASRVKIYAIRALGRLRQENAEIQQCFLWALLYESEMLVRYEALHSLVTVNRMDKSTVDVLKSRFLVEDDIKMIRLLRRTLNNVGINVDEDIDTVAEVKSEVRRFLSDRNHISDVILTNEAEEDYRLQKEIMITTMSGHLTREGSSRTLRVSFADDDDICLESSESDILDKEDMYEKLNDMVEEEDMKDGVDIERRYEMGQMIVSKENDTLHNEDMVEKVGVDKIGGMVDDEGMKDGVDIEKGNEEGKMLLDNENDTSHNEDMVEKVGVENIGGMVEEEEMKDGVDIERRHEEGQMIENKENDTLHNEDTEEKDREEEIVGMEEEDGTEDGVNIVRRDKGGQMIDEKIDIEDRRGDFSVKNIDEVIVKGLYEENREYNEKIRNTVLEEKLNEEIVNCETEKETFIKIVDDIKDKEEPLDGNKEEMDEKSKEDQSVKEWIKDDVINDGIYEEVTAETEETEEEDNVREEEDSINVRCEKCVESVEMEDSVSVISNMCQGKADNKGGSFGGRDNLESEVTCSYKLPSDSSYLRIHSSDMSLVWMNSPPPLIIVDQQQLEDLERTLSLGIIDEVNDAIGFEGIDCASEDIL